MILKIWERYLIKELLKTFFFIIVIFYGFYCLIDYAAHTSSYNQQNVQPSWFQLSVYYAAEFSKRLDVLIPASLLISSLRVLCMLNIHRELVALQASGISKQRLLRPFFLVGLFFVAFAYLNQEYLMPKAYHKIKLIQAEYQMQRDKAKRNPMAQHFVLKDGTTVLYHRYDEMSHTLYDTYWVKNANQLWHMKELSLEPSVPEGLEVRLLERENEHLVVTETFPKRSFSEIQFNKRKLFETLSPPDELSLSQLWDKMVASETHNSEKRSELTTTFYRKLTLPWFTMLALIGPAPFCMRYSRSFPVFMTFALSIFGLVAFYLMTDAAAVLGKRQLIAPIVSVFAPFFIMWSFVGYKVCKN